MLQIWHWLVGMLPVWRPLVWQSPLDSLWAEYNTSMTIGGQYAHIEQYLCRSKHNTRMILVHHIAVSMLPVWLLPVGIIAVPSALASITPVWPTPVCMLLVGQLPVSIIVVCPLPVDMLPLYLLSSVIPGWPSLVTTWLVWSLSSNTILTGLYCKHHDCRCVRDYYQSIPHIYYRWPFLCVLYVPYRPPIQPA